MSEPIDPNAQPGSPAPSYQPPPPYAPPGPSGSPPGYGAPQPGVYGAPPGPSGSPPGYDAPAPGAYGTPPGAYGAPAAYGPPGAYGASWPESGAPSPAPAPSRRRRNVLIVALAALVVVGGGIGALVAYSSSSNSNKLPMPASFDGYYKVGQSSQVEAGMRQMLAGFGGNGALGSATFGLYSHNSGDQPELIAFAVPTHDIPASARSNFGSQLQVLGASMQEYPAGPHGGTSDCGELSLGAIDEVICAWSDASTSGALVSVIEPVTPDRLAKIERDLRDFID